jgi:hypothetical protein
MLSVLRRTAESSQEMIDSFIIPAGRRSIIGSIDVAIDYRIREHLQNTRRYRRHSHRTDFRISGHVPHR